MREREPDDDERREAKEQRRMRRQRRSMHRTYDDWKTDSGREDDHDLESD